MLFFECEDIKDVFATFFIGVAEISCFVRKKLT